MLYDTFPAQLRIRNVRIPQALEMVMKRLQKWVVLIAAFAAPATNAASVSGQFTLASEPFKPAEVAAFRVRDRSNPHEYATFVILTAKAVDKDKIGASRDPYGLATKDPAASHADTIKLWVRKNGEVTVIADVAGTHNFDTSATSKGQLSGTLTASCKENTPTHVACTVKTAHERKSMSGQAYTLDLGFDAGVIDRKHGKPIAADGEAPGKAFLALRDALTGSDLKQVLALLSPHWQRELNWEHDTPEENMQRAKDRLLGMGTFVPAQPRITGGEWMSEDAALLEVEGLRLGMRTLFEIEMQRIDGRWVYDNTHSIGMLPD